jgi:hypothetical protein
VCVTEAGLVKVRSKKYCTTQIYLLK